MWEARGPRRGRNPLASLASSRGSVGPNQSAGRDHDELGAERGGTARLLQAGLFLAPPKARSAGEQAAAAAAATVAQK